MSGQKARTDRWHKVTVRLFQNIGKFLTCLLNLLWYQFLSGYAPIDAFFRGTLSNAKFSFAGADWESLSAIAHCFHDLLSAQSYTTTIFPYERKNSALATSLLFLHSSCTTLHATKQLSSLQLWKLCAKNLALPRLWTQNKPTGVLSEGVNLQCSQWCQMAPTHPAPPLQKPTSGNNTLTGGIYSIVQRPLEFWVICQSATPLSLSSKQPEGCGSFRLLPGKLLTKR